MERKFRILILLILVLVLYSCSKVTTNPSSATKTNTPSPINPIYTSTPETRTTAIAEQVPSPTVMLPSIEVKTGELKGTHVQFWHPWTNKTAEGIEKLGEQFNSENPYGITVEIISHGNNLDRNVLDGLNNGNTPNITASPVFQIHSWDNYISIIQDLDHYIYNPIWGLKTSEINDFYPIFFNRDKDPIKRTSLPGFAISNLIIYNHTWAKDLGFDSPPFTPSEFKEQACAAAAEKYRMDGDTGTGGWISNFDPSSIIGWVAAFDGNITDTIRDGYEFETPEFEKAFNFIKGMFTSGCAISAVDLYSENQFSERGGLFYSTNITSFPYIASSFESSELGDKWTAIPYPSEKGEPILTLSTYSFSILRSTTEVELASWLFIKWLIDPEIQAEIVKVSGFIPTRISSNKYLTQYATDNPPWAVVQERISGGIFGPESGSWNIVRWILSDAVRTLVSPGFSDDEIPLLVKELNTVADEVHLNNP